MALEIQILAKNRSMNITGLMGSSLSLSLSLSQVLTTPTVRTHKPYRSLLLTVNLMSQWILVVKLK
jgi:hypothetical protein